MESVHYSRCLTHEGGYMQSEKNHYQLLFTLSLQSWCLENFEKQGGHKKEQLKRRRIWNDCKGGKLAYDFKNHMGIACYALYKEW